MPAQPGPAAFPQAPFPGPGFPQQPGYPPASAPPYPTSAAPYPTSAPPGPYPTSAPPGPYGYGPYGPPPPQPAKKRRGLLVAIIVAAVLAVLLGGGGTAVYLATRGNSGGTGQASPTEAVQGFLTAVYQDMDATKAATFVCSDARDKAKLTNKINQIRRADANYDTPKYDWTTPQIEQTRTDEAILSTTVTLTTANEQVARQKLRFVTIRSNGWWVCEVNQTS
ncbi:MAG TPA: hypothetical protein VJT31_11725 [Rugosimonospora sp.]|nr:hypothetical protein [Rugosimonospora sp.]